MSKSENIAGKLTQLRVLMNDLSFDDDYYKSDGYLLRWLQYMNFDVTKADIAFRKRIEWRKEYKMDSILEEEFTDLAARFPIDISDVDKNGRIVVKVMIQAFNCKNFKLDRTKEYYIRFALWMNEGIEQRLKEQFHKTNGSVGQFIGVVDCTKMSDHVKDIGMRNIYGIIMVVKEAVSQLTANFPRGAEITYILNASKLFTLFYTALKPIFGKETLNALQIYGSESKFDWRSEHY